MTGWSGRRSSGRVRVRTKENPSEEPFSFHPSRTHGRQTAANLATHPECSNAANLATRPENAAWRLSVVSPHTNTQNQRRSSLQFIQVLYHCF